MSDDPSSETFDVSDYYSLLELLDKLGKEGVTELISKGNPNRITRGDMIYFSKEDVHHILGEDLFEDSDSMEVIVDDYQDTEVGDLAARVVFRQSVIKRYQVGTEEEIYRGRILDLSERKEVLYGRSAGDERDRAIFKECAVISSVHGKLYLDEEMNLLYENLGANKTKIRGWKDSQYNLLGKGETGVLIPREALRSVAGSGQTIMASFKIGFQKQPHFIVRIYASAQK